MSVLAWALLLNLSDLTIHLTAFTVGSCLRSANWSHLRKRWRQNSVKNSNPQIVTHPGITHGLSCLTSVTWPFPLIAFTFGLCLYCANVSHFKDGWAVNVVFLSSQLAQICTITSWPWGNYTKIGPIRTWAHLVFSNKIWEATGGTYSISPYKPWQMRVGGGWGCRLNLAKKISLNFLFKVMLLPILACK